MIAFIVLLLLGILSSLFILFIDQTSKTIPESSYRNAIEYKFPEFKDFENQESFAGNSLKFEIEKNEYYYAYIIHGSGLPIAKATCFKVDSKLNVIKIGEFPDIYDSYSGYRDVSPLNCKGIK